MSELRREDLHDLRDTFKEGLKGITDQLTLMNGRVRKAEVDIGRLDERVIKLEAKPLSAVVGTDRRQNARPVTWRDIKVAWATILGVIALVETIAHGGPALVRMMLR